MLTSNFRLMLSKASSIKKECYMYACQSLDNVDMYKYAKFYQNIPRGSRVKSVFANCRRTEGRTDLPTFMFFLSILHVIKVSNNTKSTQQYSRLLRIKSYF